MFLTSDSLVENIYIMLGRVYPLSINSLYNSIIFFFLVENGFHA